jgi:WhiB family redox-sensing transcriptional regulator
MMPAYQQCSGCDRTPQYLRRGMCGACYRRAQRAGEIVSDRCDGTSTREHITVLLAGGWPRNAISRAAQINKGRFHNLMNSTGYVLTKTRDAVLALDPASPPAPLTSWTSPLGRDRGAAGRTRDRLWRERVAEIQLREREAADKREVDKRQRVLAAVDAEARERREIEARVTERRAGKAWDTVAVTGIDVEDLPSDEWDWREEAVCRQVDHDIFFPEKGGSTREAKKVCLSCPVKDQCLGWALDHEERFGIWGGLSERERRKILKPAIYDNERYA